jgi:hypothetical protein
MKKNTLRHWKVATLASLLSVRRAEAVGLLHALWEFVGDQAPNGEITAIPFSHVARESLWEGDADALKDALLTARLLDNGDDRLFIHDWFDHCEDMIHIRLARKGERFATGQVPNMARLSKDERARLESVYATPKKRTANARRTHGERTKYAPPRPAIALPCPALPCPALEEETTLPPGGGDQISESAKPGPKKEKKVKKKPDNPPAPRPRNIWWDAICDIFGMKPVTRQDETRLGRLARDFKLKCDAAGVAPEEIEARRDVLAARWAKNDEPAVVTPEALLKHWDSAEDQGGRMPDSRGPTEEETQEMYDAFDAKPTAVKRAEIEAFEKHLVETHQVREPETVARLAKVWADIHREEAEALAGKAAAV